MSRIAIPASANEVDGQLGENRLRAYWRGIEPYQRLLHTIGIILIGSGIFHTGVFLVDGGGLSGPVSWRKPITFGFSIGIAALSISWLTTYLQHNQRKGRLLLRTLAIGGAMEVFLISMQQWRGVPSHFNFFANPVDAVIAGSITFTIIPISLANLGRNALVVSAHDVIAQPGVGHSRGHGVDGSRHDLWYCDDWQRGLSILTADGAATQHLW